MRDELELGRFLVRLILGPPIIDLYKLGRVAECELLPIGTAITSDFRATFRLLLVAGRLDGGRVDGQRGSFDESAA